MLVTSRGKVRVVQMKGIDYTQRCNAAGNILGLALVIPIPSPPTSSGYICTVKLYVCLCTLLYGYVYLCMCVFTSVWVGGWVYSYARVYVYVSVCIYVFVNVFMCVPVRL